MDGLTKDATRVAPLLPRSAAGSRCLRHDNQIPFRVPAGPDSPEVPPGPEYLNMFLNAGWASGLAYAAIMPCPWC
jgi:hypothetical protein